MPAQITSETPDAELVQRAKAGELDAFETLTTRYEQRVYSLALRMLRQEQDAEDVTQQAFLSALENLKGFRGEASFSTWLLRIASHAALKVIRKRKGLDTVSLDAATDTTDNPDTIGGDERNPAAAGRGTGTTGRKTSPGVFAARRGGIVRQGNS